MQVKRNYSVPPDLSLASRYHVFLYSRRTDTIGKIITTSSVSEISRKCLSVYTYVYLYAFWYDPATAMVLKKSSHICDICRSGYESSNASKKPAWKHKSCHNVDISSPFYLAKICKKDEHELNWWFIDLVGPVRKKTRYNAKTNHTTTLQGAWWVILYSHDFVYLPMGLFMSG